MDDAKNDAAFFDAESDAAGPVLPVLDVDLAPTCCKRKRCTRGGENSLPFVTKRPCSLALPRWG